MAPNLGNKFQKSEFQNIFVLKNFRKKLKILEKLKKNESVPKLCQIQSSVMSNIYRKNVDKSGTVQPRNKLNPEKKRKDIFFSIFCKFLDEIFFEPNCDRKP